MGWQGLPRESFQRLRQLARDGDHVAVGDMLQSLRASRMQEDLISCGTLIHACEKSSAWRHAVQTLRAMQSHLFSPDELCYNCAIRAAFCRWQTALKLLLAMPAPGTASYNAAARRGTGLWKTSLWAVAEAGRNGVEVDTPGLNGAMGSLEWPCAMQLLRFALARQVRVDRITYNSAISVCDKTSWRHAIRQLRRAAGLTVRPGAAELCVTMTVLEKAKQWQPALCALQRPQKDLRLGTAALMACENWEVALCLFRQLQQESLRPDVVCYNSILRACEHEGQWQMALQLLEEAQGGFLSNEMSFNIAMAACYQQGRWELALHLFTGLGKFLRPTLVSWNSALSACQAAGHWPLAILLLRRLNAESQADEISYTSTITCCSRVGRWEVGGYMLWQMEAARVPKTRFALNAAVDAFAEPKNRRQWRWPLHFLHAMGLYSLQPDEVSRAPQKAQAIRRSI
ncbi:unnamed protein product [Effrenium voratum]|nr:unnamed protein product [Effrenium voratum]